MAHSRSSIDAAPNLTAEPGGCADAYADLDLSQQREEHVLWCGRGVHGSRERPLCLSRACRGSRLIVCPKSQPNSSPPPPPAVVPPRAELKEREV